MKIKVDRSQLEAKLLVATSILGGNVQPPILNEALFKMEEKNLSITTSDGGITMIVRLPYILESGELTDFICDVQSIIKPVTLQKNEFMFIEVMEKDIALTTPKTRKKYQVPITYKPADFPRIESEQWSDPVLINGKAFARMIKKTFSIVNSNDLRAGLSGINLYSKDGTLTIESTSGFSSCRTRFKPEEEILHELEPILVPKSLHKVSENYGKSAQVKISLDKEKRFLGINDGSSVTYVRLIDAKFPNTDTLFASYRPEVNLKVNREILMLSLDRITGFGDMTHPKMVFDMKGEGILISTENTDRRKNAEELIEVQNKSKEINFVSGIGYKVLRPAIASLNGENLFMSQVKHSSLVFVSDDSSEGFETLWMIAPMVLDINKNEDKEKEAEVNF